MEHRVTDSPPGDIWQVISGGGLGRVMKHISVSQEEMVLGLVVHTCDPSSQEAEAGGPENLTLKYMVILYLKKGLAHLF